MAYEIDETTSLLARHVAALDDISAKITHPLNAGQGHGQGQRQGQGQGLVTGQRQGVVTRQGLRMANATDMMTSSASSWQRLHLDIDDSNDADTIGNRTNNHVTSAVQLTSSGSHNEDTMAVALREQIQARPPPHPLFPLCYEMTSWLPTKRNKSCPNPTMYYLYYNPIFTYPGTHGSETTARPRCCRHAYRRFCFPTCQYQYHDH